MQSTQTLQNASNKGPAAAVKSGRRRILKLGLNVLRWTTAVALFLLWHPSHRQFYRGSLTHTTVEKTGYTRSGWELHRFMLSTQVSWGQVALSLSYADTPGRSDGRDPVGWDIELVRDGKNPMSNNFGGYLLFNLRAGSEASRDGSSVVFGRAGVPIWFALLLLIGSPAMWRRLKQMIRQRAERRRVPAGPIAQYPA